MVVVTWEYILILFKSNTHLKYFGFIVYKLYLNKIDYRTNSPPHKIYKGENNKMVNKLNWEDVSPSDLR